MKKIIAAVCVGVVLVGAFIAASWWHQQRQAVRAQLIDADEAIRTLDQYSDQQYSGGPIMDLTQADLRARDKVAALDYGYHTENENFCGTMIGSELSIVETRVSIRRAIYARISIEPTPKAIEEAHKNWPAPLPARDSCIDNLK